MGTLSVSLTVLLAAGCATMPDSGPPETVHPTQGAGADQGVQVRVIPMPPRDGLSPREVLQNFLDASIADEADYRTAKQYLTPDAAAQWRPEESTVVLANTALQAPAGDDTAAQVQLTISSAKLGLLDERHTYHSATGTYGGLFTLVNVAKDAKDGKDPKDRAQWRIAALPAGLVMDKTSFQNAYQQVAKYYFTRDQQAGTGEQPVLVPDPVYLRRRIDPAGAAVRAVAQGPSDWLAPAVRSAFEGGVTVTAVSSDDPRLIKVQVDGVDCVTSDRQCHQMAAQLYYTLSQGGSGSLERLQLVAKRGSAEFTATQAKAAAFAPGQLAGSGQAYARKAKTGQLVQIGQDNNPVAVAGVLGAATPAPGLAPVGDQPQGAFAVRRGGSQAAVVSEDGRSLYVAALDDGAKQLGPPVATSRAGQGPGLGLASPSWDGYGGLWVVDRDPLAPRVLLITDGAKTTVPVEGLGSLPVDSLRVSSDGTRVALLLRNSDGTRSLRLGLVVRGGSAQAPTVSIVKLRPVAAVELSDVTSVSWADPDTLLVLGKESDSVPQLHYLSTDGSSGLETAVQAVDGMTVVAASESRLDPVLGDAKGDDHAVYGLSGSMQPQWRAYSKGVTQPGYQG
ncbi:hypothetical protein C7C46_31290 [Streptomyces tateyamensis]|uniref:Uncharacterized protein n=1 Tax=Streptomyces tateyamensis TaxID=565073 RepID=A0A2V4MT06_9ACTN|nr:hypothetical protein C7C46_31290 [Streptomyces tateyamensis]